MKRLDARANGLPLTGVSDIDLLGGRFDLMPNFKALLDSSDRAEIDANATRFSGLYRYEIMLSNVAEGSRMGQYACRAECPLPAGDKVSRYL